MTTHCEKKFLHGSRLDLSSNSFILYILLRVVSALRKNVSSAILSKPCIILCVSSRSPLFRLASNVVSLHSFYLWSYGNSLNGVIILVARCWTCSRALISLFKYAYGDPVCMRGMTVSVSLLLMVRLICARAWFAFSTASAPCLLPSIALCTITPKSFSSSIFSFSLCIRLECSLLHFATLNHHPLFCPLGTLD